MNRRLSLVAAGLLFALRSLAVAQPSTAPSPFPTVLRDDAQVVVQNGLFRLRIDLVDGGRTTVEWPGGIAIRGMTARAVIGDRQSGLATENAATRSVESVGLVQDTFGDGVRLTLRHDTPDQPSLRQHFWIYADRPEFYAQLDLVAAEGQTVSSRTLMPVIVDGKRAGAAIDFRNASDMRFLNVPYDNDDYSRYGAFGTPLQGVTSSEVGAMFDAVTRRALIVGSVSHDLWKSFASFEYGQVGDGARRQSMLGVLTASGSGTHDNEPHGIVTGAVVSSPKVFVGAFDDWRDGMEAYGRANAVVQPPLPWAGPKPFGWNSWAAHKAKLTEPHVAAAIDLTATLRDGGFADEGVAYVNLDSYWDNMSDETLAALSRAAHEKGLKFGLYHTPFSYWGDDLNAAVPGTDGRYRYHDLVLRDRRSRPIKHSGYALDPTHPGTRQRNRSVYDRFAKIGVEFVKLDFMTNGALEGVHHDPTVTTGTAAYNRGMRDLVEDLGEQQMGRPVFISLSIAPLFPHGFGHSRRISCDAFSTLGATEYLLNNAGYGWWTQGTLYTFNDPDHTVVYQTMDERAVSEAEGETRFNASLVGGGMLLNSDDATNATARERVLRLFSDRPLIDLARAGRVFRPIEANTDTAAVDAFVSAGSPTYVAVFNLSEKERVTREVQLARIGVTGTPTFIDVRDGKSVGEVRGGVWRVDLEPARSVIVRIAE